MSYHYYRGADGLRFCYAPGATYRCPLAPESEPKLLTLAAAELLKCDAAKLARIFERMHNVSLRERDEATGKLTETCRVCGSKLDRLGFAAWAERDKPEADSVGERISEAVFGAVVEQVEPRRYFERKREAMSWAVEEARISRAIAAEAR